jgi:hypothetical protein
MATLERPTGTQQDFNQTSQLEFHQTTYRPNYQIPQSEYIWDAPYLNKTQIFPSFKISPEYPTEQMLKEFSRKYYERSCGFDEYTKPIDPTDFIKYDGHNLWKTSYDVMCEHIPKIEGEEGGFGDIDNALKTDVSPRLAKRQAEAEKKVYYDPLKKYATIAETEGSHPERNPLNNHKLIQNSYFPMSRLVGSYWDKVDKVSYFRDRYDKLEFNPEERDSGFSTNLQGHIDFANMFTGQKGSNKDTEYRTNFWKKKGFQWRRLTEEPSKN